MEKSAKASSTTDPAPDLGLAREILQKHQLLREDPVVGPERERSAELLIPLLQEIQDAYGYLPPEVLDWVSGETGIPSARMYGVITFYSQFYLEPKGKYTIRCCQGTACHVKGGKAVAEAIEDHLGVQDGDTTSDMLFTYETVQCVGTCFLAPVLMVGDNYHSEMTQGSVKKILARYK